jgi:hypothetical protein
VQNSWEMAMKYVRNCNCGADLHPLQYEVSS